MVRRGSGIQRVKLMPATLLRNHVLDPCPGIADNFRMRGTAAAVLLAGCFNPTPPSGAPCADGKCPTGLVCSPATQTCEHTAVQIDAPVAMIDAPVQAIDSAIDGTPSPFAYRRRLTIKNNAGMMLPA